MSPSPAQQKQRAIMRSQRIATRTPFVTPRKPPQDTKAHANVGTEADVRAYCQRMGYAYGKVVRQLPEPRKPSMGDAFVAAVERQANNEEE